MKRARDTFSDPPRFYSETGTSLGSAAAIVSSAHTLKLLMQNERNPGLKQAADEVFVHAEKLWLNMRSTALAGDGDPTSGQSEVSEFTLMMQQLKSFSALCEEYVDVGTPASPSTRKSL
eukprot:3827602-Rhodomonas_salina.1